MSLKSQSYLGKAECFESNEETMKDISKPKRKPSGPIENKNFGKTNLTWQGGGVGAGGGGMPHYVYSIFSFCDLMGCLPYWAPSIH